MTAIASWGARLVSIALPLVTVGLAARALRPRFDDWRERWLVAAAAGAAWLALSSEALGALGQLDRRGAVLSWLVAAALAAVYWKTQAPRAPLSAPRSAGAAERALAACWVAILGTLLVVAVVSSPNSVDAMAYHLPRVARWIAHRSLDHFRAADLRQIELAPLSELGMLHSMLLWTSDRFAQSVQWLATVVALLAVAAAAARLGASRVGQGAAALFYLSVPVATLNATSTENDAVVAAWTALLALGVIAAGTERRAGLPTAAVRWSWIAGTAAGLAIYTKGTAYFFVVPLLAWAGLEAVTSLRTQGSQRRVRLLLHTVAALTVPILLLNGAFWLRNVRLFGSPLTSYPMQTVTDHDAVSTLSTVVRGLAVHVNVLGVDARGRAAVERAVRRLHDAVGVDPDDRRTTLWGRRRFEIVGAPLHEHTAGAGWHLALLAVLATAYGAGALARRLRHEPARRPRLAVGTGRLALATVAGLLLMSSLLSWQPWLAHLHLPMFPLGSVVAGVLADRLLPRRAVVALALGLAAAALPATLRNQARPLAGASSILRTDPSAQLFYAHRELRAPMTEFAARLEQSSCRTVGRVDTRGHEYEYPLWRLLNGPARTPRRFRIEDIRVRNYTRDLPLLDPTPFEPCAVVRIAGSTFEVLQAPWLESPAVPPGRPARP